MTKYCKLSDYAKKFGVTYRTAFNRFKANKILGAIRDSTNHICVPIEYLLKHISNEVTIYATVISNKEEDLKNLENQINILTQFCNARGYKVNKIVKEISSSIIDDRPKFMELLKDRNCKHIVVERKSSVCRFGFDYILNLLETDGREIEVMNEIDEDKEILTRDFVKVIYNICKIIGKHKIPKKNIKNLLDCLIINTKEEYITE